MTLLVVPGCPECCIICLLLSGSAVNVSRWEVVLVMDDTDLRAMLLSGDTDALRVQLQRLANPSAATASSSHQDEGKEEVDKRSNPVDHLVSRVGLIADDILARGLPHLEREAVALAAAKEATDAAAAAEQTFHLPDLGLTLRTTLVMSQAIWPAARALGKWLRARSAVRCAGARCIELGAGGGAPGLVARAAGARELLTTEADESLLPLLSANCAANPGSGRWTVAVLDWCDVSAVRDVATATAGGDGDAAGGGGQAGFDLVLAADCLYSVGDIRPLVRAACLLLRSGAHSRFVLARSSWFEDLQPTCVACAEEAGLALISAESVDVAIAEQAADGGASHADSSGGGRLGYTTAAGGRSGEGQERGARGQQEPPTVLEFAWAAAAAVDVIPVC